MKSQFLIASILMVTSASYANGKAGDTFFTKSLKEQVCTYAVKNKNVKGLTLQDCKRAKFTFAEDKTQVKIEGVKKPLTTLMQLEFTANGADVSAEMKAVIEVTKKGKLKRTGWEVTYVIPKSFSDEAILKNSWSRNDNVIDMDLDVEISDEVYKKMADIMESGLLESLNSISSTDSSEDDIAQGSMEDGQLILNLKTQKVLGYIFNGDIESESRDVKIFAEYKFDLNGNLVDYREESYGYNE